MRVERVVMNHKGADALLKSGEVAGLVRSHADRIASAAGPGYEADTWTGDSRVIASAFTATPKAMVDNAKNQTLLRALGGVR